ncbi:hypothetical protein CMO88_04980 [Candidatus Woesearchaeota archaeon]|nr:hypothetical protein [Candidatus Woesearchaeota archaeon]|tara:strand:+ start:1005 stop:1526 length:522 start_codon:yes stop_codon:yes gene_type:complete
MAEKTYNIPLRKEIMKVQRYKRAKKAVSSVRAYVIKHSKSSDVKIGKYLNLKLWEHGIKNVPHMVKVDITKDNKGTVTAELFGAPKEVKKEEPKKPETAVDKVKAAVAGKKEEKEKKTEVKADVKKEETTEKKETETKKEEKVTEPKKESSSSEEKVIATTDSKSNSSNNEKK